jgi:enoyl-CoA hydratase
VAIHHSVAGTVASITIDRTERRNAINLEALEALDAAFTATTDAGARCLVISGAGGHFCAGADLKELEDLAFTHRLRQVLDHLAALDIPTIAAVAGACMGLGMQLALACDIRVASDDAYFGVPVAKLGLMVDHWTLRRLAAAVGIGTARLMVLTAEILSSDDAWRVGLTQVRGGLDAAEAIAARVTGLAPLSIAGSKLGLDLIERPTTHTAYDDAFRAAWASDDLAEGRRAFAERRAPDFTGR